MDAEKVKKFIQLAGQGIPESFTARDSKTRALGAQLLLSEVLEYVIKGLGLNPEIGGVKITDADSVSFSPARDEPDHLEMLDGLADVAYTMYWNAAAFGLCLEEAFQLVCDNNLDKFVRLDGWQGKEGRLEPACWHCGQNVSWPPEVASIEVVRIGTEWYAVGKDAAGKVRKPCHYRAVDLSVLTE